MILKKYLLIFFSIIFFYCISTTIIFACQCGEIPTVLSQFEMSSNIFIAKIVSIEKVKYNSSYEEVTGAKIIVQKVYKGNYKVDKEFFVAQGNDGICTLTYDKSNVGDELLVYSLSFERFSQNWQIGYCGRTTELKFAGDDLLYLDNFAKVVGKSRISGTLHYWGRGENKPSVENQIIKITNYKTKKSYKVKTNQDGVYEIYGLPAGWYYVETEPAKGWKSDNLYRRYLPVDYQAYEKLDEKDYPQNPQNKEGWTKPDAFYLFPNRHAGLDFNFTNQK